MKIHTPEELKILDEFMRENNLTLNTKLYRYTSKEYLLELNNQLYLKAKSEPLDMVVDNYHGSSHVFISSDIGQGLSFLDTKENEYENPDRICVSLKLQDVLDQGGLVYTVTSLPEYLKVFFCTIPEGKIKVTDVS